MSLGKRTTYGYLVILGPHKNHSRKAEILFIATMKAQGLLKWFHVWMIFGRIEMLKSRFMPLHGHEPRLSRGSAPLTTFPLAQPQIHVFFTKILYTNTGALLTILKYKFSIKRRFSMWDFVIIFLFCRCVQLIRFLSLDSLFYSKWQRHSVDQTSC